MMRYFNAFDVIRGFREAANPSCFLLLSIMKMVGTNLLAKRLATEHIDQGWRLRAMPHPRFQQNAFQRNAYPK